MHWAIGGIFPRLVSLATNHSEFIFHSQFRFLTTIFLDLPAENGTIAAGASASGRRRPPRYGTLSGGLVSKKPGRFFTLTDISISGIHMVAIYMRMTNVFEAQARETTFKSMEEFRTWVKNHALLAEYATDLLLERGVVWLGEDGGVVGRDPKNVRVDGSPVVWGEKWPSRKALMEALLHPVRLREAQEELKEAGEVSSHWLCLHAIWALEKEGMVEKAGKEYALTEAGRAARMAQLNADSDKFDQGVAAIATGCIKDGRISLTVLLEKLKEHDPELDKWDTEIVQDVVLGLTGRGLVPKMALVP